MEPHDPRPVIADASPLIALAAAKRFDVLRRLYGRVVVTRAVLDEVMAGGNKPGARELSAAMREGWIRGTPTPSDTWAFLDLGIGEASTIALALRHPGALVLMDDVPGRERAALHGIETVDSAAVLQDAEREGLV
ncbi:MAG TPA: DUF3368 domain-containing protein [Gammaproteobacteria bacterium]